MYTTPSITELGTLAELTQTNINKNAGSGDVIVINGQTESAPGSKVTSISGQ